MVRGHVVNVLPFFIFLISGLAGHKGFSIRTKTVGYPCHIGYVLHKSVPAVLSHSSLSLSCV